MDYYLLLDLVAELGYRLAMCGAETYRIEESVTRIMAAYGIEAEVFSIPNCLHVSIEGANGKPMTRMRRIGIHGNDLEAVERYSNLSRRICAEHPDPAIAYQWLKETGESLRSYHPLVYLAGNFMGGCGYSVIFGGNLFDCLCGGICGLIVGIVTRYLDRLKTNHFFKIIATSFIMAVIAYICSHLGFAQNVDAVIIGTLMILVPGLLFTNAMRDIIYGDTNSGINRIVQVFLIAVAIVLGTGAALKATSIVWGAPVIHSAFTHSLWIEALAAFVGCYGFTIIFNIHGRGVALCALGGVLTWVAYRMILFMGGDDILAYFFATLLAAFYSEVMARVRKYPAISYLVISIFPLIPGAGAYYTMNSAFRGDLSGFTSQGTHTIAIAGVMAVGILMASTTVRIVNDRLNQIHIRH